MATGNLTQDNQSVEYNIVTLFEKLDNIRRDGVNVPRILPAQAEMRTLEFWRSIISECLASFFYVFIVCGTAAAVSPSGSPALGVLSVAMASGFSIAALTQSFGHVSGKHSLNIIYFDSQTRSMFQPSGT